MLPLVDLRAEYASIRGEIDAALKRVLEGGTFILGPEVERFERSFAAYCEVSHAVGVASGTAALHLALRACGVGAGDEVVTSPFTFMATAEAIWQSGARPRFADIDESTFALDPRQVEAAIGPRTRAILPVHLYGHPADMESLGAIARRRSLTLIEDAAQAHGARLGGRRVGGFGAAACFSFYPAKNLGAYGDAGMVVTQDAPTAERVRLLRDHGRRDKYEHEVPGYGERLDALQAAVLGVKLARLDEWNERRRRAAGLYRDLLAGAPLVLPETAAGAEPVHHLFVVRVAQRDRVRERLAAAGIATGVHYPIPLHLQRACASLDYPEGSFPAAERAAREVLSLPLYPGIADSDVERAAAALRSALGA